MSGVFWGRGTKVIGYNPACEFCYDCLRHGHTDEECPNPYKESNKEINVGGKTEGENERGMDEIKDFKELINGAATALCNQWSERDCSRLKDAAAFLKDFIEFEDYFFDQAQDPIELGGYRFKTDPHYGWECVNREGEGHGTCRSFIDAWTACRQMEAWDE